MPLPKQAPASLQQQTRPRYVIGRSRRQDKKEKRYWPCSSFSSISPSGSVEDSFEYVYDIFRLLRAFSVPRDPMTASKAAAERVRAYNTVHPFAGITHYTPPKRPVHGRVNTWHTTWAVNCPPRRYVPRTARLPFTLLSAGNTLQ